MRKTSSCLMIVVALSVGASADAAEGPCRGQTPDGASVTIADEDEPGTRMIITGVVFDSESGEPLAGVDVYAYQTDAEGYYSANRGMNNRDPRLCGVLRTGESGEFLIVTIRPADYATGGVRAHVHFVTYGDGLSEQAHLLQFTSEVKDWPEGGIERSEKSRSTARVQSVYADSDGILHVIRDLAVRR